MGKNYDPAFTWSNLGVLGRPMTPAGMTVVPEANPAMLVALLAVIVIAHR